MREKSDWEMLLPTQDKTKQDKTRQDKLRTTIRPKLSGRTGPQPCDIGSCSMRVTSKVQTRSTSAYSSYAHRPLPPPPPPPSPPPPPPKTRPGPYRQPKNQRRDEGGRGRAPPLLRQCSAGTAAAAAAVAAVDEPAPQGFTGMVSPPSPQQAWASRRS
eukprot:COSAG06_NODE_7396_length_2518_cov_1.825134_3_plen_157_part_01